MITTIDQALENLKRRGWLRDERDPMCFNYCGAVDSQDDYIYLRSDDDIIKFCQRLGAEDAAPDLLTALYKIKHLLLLGNGQAGISKSITIARAAIAAAER